MGIGQELIQEVARYEFRYRIFALIRQHEEHS